MNIKNHTSEVPAAVSMSRIEKQLVEAGARNIMKEYNDDGSCHSICFVLPMNGKQLTFKLPARTESIYRLLVAEYVRPTALSFEKCKKQSERTAWKIIADWVEIQITMINLEQAEVLQVFFPYLHDGKETFYDKLKGGDFKLLIG